MTKLYYYYKDKDGKLHVLEDESLSFDNINVTIQELKEKFQTNVLAVIEEAVWYS